MGRGGGDLKIIEKWETCFAASQNISTSDWHFLEFFSLKIHLAQNLWIFIKSIKISS